MQLFERLWAVATSLISFASLSALPDSTTGETALQLPLLSAVSSSVPSTLLVPEKEKKPCRDADDKPVNYPCFSPPGAPDNFFCEYPDLVGWRDCSHDLDRRCWVRELKTGKQYDINTDYEKRAPPGIVRNVNLTLVDSWYAADGLNFTEAKLFNNTYPGPWIQACWGDRIVANVTNGLRHNGTSVHWHGIRQLNTTHMDGVNGVTQCPIRPKDYFVYNFTLPQYGSSWYHSHYSVQYADGAVGPLTIHGPSSGDWDEAASEPLILTDWYHNSAFSVVSGGPEGGKDILLNGRGDIRKYNSTAQNNTAVKPALNITFEKPVVGQGCKKYLLRVINTSFDTTFVFSIDNHLLQVVSADFVPIQPYRNTSILIGIGQRYNIVVEANPLNRYSHLDPAGNYWIRTQIAKCFRGNAEGSPGYDEVGILRYNASSTCDPSTKRWPNISLKCSDETYTSLTPILPWNVSSPVNGKFKPDAADFGQDWEVFFNRSTAMKKYFPLARFVMDVSTSSIPMRVDYSDPIFLNLARNATKDPWPEMWRVEAEEYTNHEWIYLVLRGNPDENIGTSGAHPIHLHGHDFAILEQAEDKVFNASNLNLKLNNPPRRDVVLLPEQGYVVIAFKADNPGPWLVHCHIAFHISFGLGMQILEDQRGAYKMWPANDSAIVEAQRVCDNWKDWQKNEKNWANKPVRIGGNCTEEHEEFCFQDDSGV